MSRHRFWSLPLRRSQRSSAAPHPLRRTGLELLEERLTLNTAPTLAEIGDQTVQSGTPLHIALDGFDSDADDLTFSAEVTGNNDLTTFIPENNRSLRISVAAFEQFAGGDMLLEMFEGRTPNTTARIIELAEQGYYDGLTFHRSAFLLSGDPFVIQGGSSDGQGGAGSGTTMDDEFHRDLQHTGVGIVSMAKTSDDDTGDSQFFVTGGPARWLDFDHSVFGLLTDGDEVREAIQNTPTDDNDKPIDDVVMTSVTVEYDHENGVLMLSAPEGVTGEADVTVTVSDGEATTTRTFHVTIVPDTENTKAFMPAVDDIHTSVDTPTTVTLPGIDVEGDAITYGFGLDEALPLEATIDETTGELTITPTDGAIGVFEILVGVTTDAWASFDSQLVPVFVHPDVPVNVELLAGSDTGLPGDGVTDLDNSLGNELSFHVEGLIPGAIVQLFADGHLIAAAEAPGQSMALTTAGDYTLADGTHSITARQVLDDEEVAVGNRNQLVDLASKQSAPISIVIDTTPPAFTSQPVLGAAEGVDYAYDVQTDEELAGTQIEYQLLQAPNGMSIDAASGLITWTPPAGIATVQSVVVEAIDPTGNANQQSFFIDVNELPELDPIGNRQVDELSLLEFDVTAADENAPLTYSLDPGAPFGAEIIKINDGLATFRFTPTEVQGPGLYPVTIRVTDATGLSTAETIQITVGEINEPPGLNPIANQDVAEGDLVDLVLGIGDVDLPANELTVTLDDGAPADAVVFRDGTNWRFSWQTDEADGGGSFPIKILVSDGTEAVEQTFTVDVQETDSPPVIETPGTQVVEPGRSVELTVRATDPDTPANTQFTFTLEGDVPDGVELAAAGPDSATLTWSVPADYPMGTVALTVKATEIGPGGQPGASSVATVTIEVFDLRMMLVNAMLRGATTPLQPIAPVAQSAEALLLAIEGGTNGAPAEFDSPPAAGTPTAASEMTGIFGTQLAPETGAGSVVSAPATDEIIPANFDAPTGDTPDELIVPTGAEASIEPDTSETTPTPEPIDPAAADAALLAMAEAEAPVDP